MARYTVNQRRQIVDWWNEARIRNARNKLTYVQRKCLRNFGRSISKVTILALANKWNNTGSMVNLHKGRSGRQATVQTDVNRRRLSLLMRRDPQQGTRPMSRQLRNVSRTSVQRMMKTLNKFPY